MRISCEPNDIGHQWWLHASKQHVVEVFFEGVKITHGITADERLGYIKAYVLDECGMPCKDHTGEALMTKELHGRVRIVLKLRPILNKGGC